MEDISDAVKKNLLDLQYNKYLQYYNTTVIVLVSYFIGAGIAYLTKQIDLNDPGQFLSFGSISITSIAICVSAMLYFKKHQQNILEEIKKLRL